MEASFSSKVSNPYVKVILIHADGMRTEERRTHVQQDELHPVFMEDFTFESNIEEIKPGEHEAQLRFEVWDEPSENALLRASGSVSEALGIKEATDALGNALAPVTDSLGNAFAPITQHLGLDNEHRFIGQWHAACSSLKDKVMYEKTLFESDGLGSITFSVTRETDAKHQIKMKKKMQEELRAMRAQEAQQVHLEITVESCDRLTYTRNTTAGMIGSNMDAIGAGKIAEKVFTFAWPPSLK